MSSEMWHTSSHHQSGCGKVWQSVRFGSGRPQVQILPARQRHASSRGHGGCSSDGRALGCDPGCRGFDPRHSPEVPVAVAAGTPFTRYVAGREPLRKGAVTGNPPCGTRQGVQHLVKVIGLWRSLVARGVRDAEVAGSNPVSPTMFQRISSLHVTMTCKECARNFTYPRPSSSAVEHSPDLRGVRGSTPRRGTVNEAKAVAATGCDPVPSGFESRRSPHLMPP